MLVWENVDIETLGCCLGNGEMLEGWNIGLFGGCVGGWEVGGELGCVGVLGCYFGIRRRFGMLVAGRAGVCKSIGLLFCGWEG